MEVIKNFLEEEAFNVLEKELTDFNKIPFYFRPYVASEEETDKLTNRDGSNASITNVDPTVTSITIEQTLIDFGRGAELAKSKIGIDLAKAKLLKEEQDILYKSIEAYTGLVTAIEKLKINKSNYQTFFWFF